MGSKLIPSSINLAYALNTGSGWVYGTSQVPYSPLFYNPGSLYFGTSGYYDPSINGLYDPRVTTIFRDVQYYTCLINSSPSTKQRRPEYEFHTVLCSFHYRLLGLRGTLDDVLSECLRLAMLAFLATTFQYPGTRAHYPYLADRFRECCRAIEVGTKGELREVMRWLLIVGAISVFEVGADIDKWMRERWRTDVDSNIDWEEARTQLKGIMWIDALHDGIGKKAFETLDVNRTA